MTRTLTTNMAAAALLVLAVTASEAAKPGYELHDSHFHLTNYVQNGTDIRQFLEIMGNKVGRVALFGIPLQQMWSYENSGEFAPTYYLQSDAPLYYYSFTDAWIATAYQSLSRKDQARFDPMITGFNPADMYAADHIRRVLQTFPGVFSGIGEFTIHKEFVSAKVAGGEPSLANKALDRIFDLAAEAGLVVLIHNDIDMPFAKEGVMPVYLDQMKDLLLRHPEATVVWAHVGMGRVVHPVQSEASASAAERPLNQVGIVENMLGNPALNHLYFDISWNEVAKYVVATPENTRLAADIINRYPDRFLFGTDEVAPPDQATYLRVYRQYDPLWALLTPEAKAKVLKGNYERIFDAARVKVRKWEAANLK
jgi:predicted TIM-barrel fold metal-dependent hydrolase